MNTLDTRIMQLVGGVEDYKIVFGEIIEIIRDVADKYALWKGNLTQADHKSITGDLYDHFIQNIYR